MSTHGTIRRYTLIIEKITSSKYPSFAQLKEFLNDHGFEISPRTLQRDVEQIRNEFKIEIKYNRSSNGYFIDENSNFDLATFLRFLEISGTANLISESLKDGKQTMNYISFESEGNLKGIENLKALLFSIKNKRRVSFSHLSFKKDGVSDYLLEPYLLKEYQNRWYVFGFVKAINEFRTFGIDRIENLKVLTEKFVVQKNFNPKERFENIIGLVFPEQEPEEVILSFTPLQAKYIKTLPLHRSQEIIKESKSEVMVKLFVKTNYELVQRILMLGDQVKVIKPLTLADEVRDMLVATLKKYKS